MPIITDQTIQEIAEQIGRKNKVLLDWINNYTPTSWLGVQADVRAGKAKQKYAIGDELITSYVYSGITYDFPWVVLDNDRECEWEDGTKHPGLWLGAKYCTIENVQFDAPENTVVDLTEEPNAIDGWYYWGVTGSTYTALNLAAGAAIPTTYDSVSKCGINDVGVLKTGYNRWKDCAQRQWLNSDTPDIGEWWTAAHLGDVAPAQLNTLKGFKAGLSSDFLSVVKPVKIQTSCNTVTDGGVTDTTVDAFFLQSIEELYGVPEIAGVEGPYYPYWKQVTGLDNPSNGASSDTNNARKIQSVSAPSGSAANVRLRSANRGKSYNTWAVNSSGYLNCGSNFHGANLAYVALPACVIS